MRIALVEDHIMFREVLKRICTADCGHSVAFETGSAVEAADLIRRLTPDAVILDLVLNDCDGFHVIDLIADIRHKMRVLVLSSYCDEYTVLRVEEAGVDGFIDKGTDAIDELHTALTAIEQGKVYFSPRFRAVRLSRITDPHAFSKMLSLTEQRFVSLAGKGLDDDELARVLLISRRTVQTYRHNILRKLGLKSAIALAAYSVKMGFSRYGISESAASARALSPERASLSSPKLS
jgi:DNA-binding NarL/FixJ family response regulator